MLRTLGQYMLGSAATFGYDDCMKYSKKMGLANTLQLLHVHWHDDPDRKLPHSHGSLPESASTARQTNGDAYGETSWRQRDR